MYKNAIFDADGTIINSFNGISECLQYSVNKIGKPPLREEILKKFIGPSLYDSFQIFAGYTFEETEKVTKIYREIYEKTGIYKCTLYDGYPEIFERLKKSNIRMSVASSKPKEFLQKIFENHNIAHYFEKIEGPVREKSNSDKLVHILDAKLDDNAIMIGDRKFDIEAANKAGIDSIGVTYGFSETNEFIEYPPTYIANNTDEIFRIITKGKK